MWLQMQYAWASCRTTIATAALLQYIIVLLAAMALQR
jgi:hypothetical protein